jgi:hypothetical protein
MFDVECMLSYLAWKHRFHSFNFAKLSPNMSLFTCLKLYAGLVSRVVCFTHHIFRKKKVPTFFASGPFLKNICFDIAFHYALVSALIFLFQIKGFLVLFQHKKISRRKFFKILGFVHNN